MRVLGHPLSGLLDFDVPSQVAPLVDCVPFALTECDRACECISVALDKSSQKSLNRVIATHIDVCLLLLRDGGQSTPLAYLNEGMKEECQKWSVFMSIPQQEWSTARHVVITWA